MNRLEAFEASFPAPLAEIRARIGHYVTQMTEDIRVRFGQRLRSLRQRRGWTQVELAERLGLDRSYLADVERGHRNVSLVNLELIAIGFDLTLSRLFSRF